MDAELMEEYVRLRVALYEPLSATPHFISGATGKTMHFPDCSCNLEAYEKELKAPILRRIKEIEESEDIGHS